MCQAPWLIINTVYLQLQSFTIWCEDTYQVTYKQGKMTCITHTVKCKNEGDLRKFPEEIMLEERPE